MAKQKQHGGPRSFKGALAALVVFVALILIFLWRYSGLATVPAEAPAAQSAALSLIHISEPTRPY